MCGEHKAGSSDITATLGSSPHVRGAPGLPGQGGLIWGIIPACAGSTGRHRVRANRAWDHPRMCGEHNVSFGITNFPQGSSPHVRGALTVPHTSRIGAGSSPHVRGAREVRCFRHLERGIIPACAGSTSHSSKPIFYQRDHPRMCGEHSIVRRQVRCRAGSSPHVRGAPE